MASANIFDFCTCGICLQTFDESSKCPRMLSCGHSFCHSCLGRLLASNQSCPTCRAEILFQSPESIPINYSLKSLINFRSQILLPNTFTNLGGFIKAAYKELRKQVFQRVEEELSQRKTRTEILTESLRELEEERKSLIEEIKRKELELKDREKRIQELESLKVEENKFCDQFKQLQTMVDNSRNYAEFSKNLIVLENLLEEGKKQIPVELPVRHLPQTRESLETLYLNRSVYVVEDRYHGTRYGKVALKDGRILVNSFQQEKPEDATLFALPELLSRFNNGSSELPKTVFLRVTPGENDYDNYSADDDSDSDDDDSDDDNSGVVDDSFEIIIETDGLTPRAKNFILLCSGLKGPSYKGLTMGKDFNFSDNYSCYYDIHSHLLPLVEGVRDDDPGTPLKEGDVYGMGERNSWFDIPLKDNPSYSDHKFGVVVAGLQRLKEIRGRKCSIEECGLVI